MLGALTAYEGRGLVFIICVRKTARLVEELKAAVWKPSPSTDTDGECEFSYQRNAGGKPIGSSRCATQKKPKPAAAYKPEQYQLFDTPVYNYPVFVTNM